MTEAATEAFYVSESIDDAQIDKFFESGGNDEVLPTAPVEDTQQTQKQEVTQEQAASPAEQAEQQAKQEKMVPYGAMHEERMRRQELQREVQEQKQRAEKLERTFQEFVQRANTPQERAPSFEEDPLEALRYNQIKIAEGLQNTHQTLEQERAEKQRHYQMERFREMCDTSVNEFEKQAPDYRQAYGWLLENRLKEFDALGYDQVTAKRLIIEDEMAIASTAYKHGANPAERIYNLAKLRGYQNTPPKVVETPQQKSTQKLDQLERGMQAAKSLGSAGGAASQELTLEALADMDDDDFAKHWDKIMGKNKG
jgi:hypothetical protein